MSCSNNDNNDDINNDNNDDDNNNDDNDDDNNDDDNNNVSYWKPHPLSQIKPTHLVCYFHTWYMIHAYYYV